MLNSITRKSLERLTALKVDKDLLMALSPEERRLLAQVGGQRWGGDLPEERRMLAQVGAPGNDGRGPEFHPCAHPAASRLFASFLRDSLH